MNIKIKKAFEDDFPAIFALIKEFSIFLKIPDKISINVDGMIQNKNYFHFLIALNNKKEIIGFASYFLVYSWVGKSLYLSDLYVS